MSTTQTQPLLSAALLKPALIESLTKLDPRKQFRNPVMFMTAVVAAVSTLASFTSGGQALGLNLQIALWLWFTVIFANFAEALAEGRGKARADALRSAQTETQAARLASLDDRRIELVSNRSLRRGDLVLVEAGQLIPGDGEVIDGIASVDESAITGESASVIRESGSDRCAVTGGTRVVSDTIVVRIGADPGESFLDRMIALVEGASRQKTPNEIALTVLLIGLSLIFLLVVMTLPAWASYAGISLSVPLLAALLVTLIPTTIGGLLSAIGIAGMDRLSARNLVAKSGRAVEAAGDVDTLLIDKTGTITFGNRRATHLVPVGDASREQLAEASLYASLADTTPEGKSIVELIREQKLAEADASAIANSIEFSASTRLSGADLRDGTQLRKGAVQAVLKQSNVGADAEMLRIVEKIARGGATPLAVSRNHKLLGIIALSDVVKPGIKARFDELRRMGIRTVMITGDNPLTAAAIAAEAGVDDYLAEATPEKKLELIRSAQAEGRLVAMCGDGSNDAPALAQADVGVAMNSGTPAAREAANLIDLDSDPTKLLDVVLVGKQMLISRGSLTTFSIANDVAKYFAIVPALFTGVYPALQALNVMQLRSPASAVLSAVIFNALIIVALIPLALRGTPYKPASASQLLARNLGIYGLGGLVAPFIGIKLVDLAINALGLV
ncbi:MULTISPECIES: potassium-transporting ATPase subunit KdpB [Hydrocarboniphaga]|uniref:Potassium-transporting ATPase ATP-binding subunit n=1 Tax=Hydrocarboniphaga effusa AP103 TaxID=1172194 RepID=I7ZAP4_9GAMM|nr:MULTISPECIES: potassium-transporting ATPase subunit KdpB [Hydrocarboniphaga]EIT68934.1 high-affinity K+ transport system [Hydrocarboniphaga effusa AP103]MDZ4081183.1 potassium-transporting ATPase subunit KdpB [Hydrocarboniphaga sp.]